MKKIFTSEIKIALVAILAIIVLFFGMQFLKGLNLFSSDAHYKMHFSDISGLSTSTPVYANGYKIGDIRDIDYDYDKPGNIIADVAVDEHMRIPAGTTARISSDLMGNVKVDLQLGNPAGGTLEPGGIIEGALSGGIADAAKDLMPQIQKLLVKVDSIAGSLNKLMADPALASSLHNINTITTNLTTSTRELNQLLGLANAKMPGLIGKADGLLVSADGLMANANGGITDVRSTLGNANNLISTVNTKVGAIDVDGLNQTLNNVNGLTAKINNGEGSLGRLMNDASLYENLNQTMRDADSLLVNLKAHPKRYVHFSLFGRKDK